MPSPETESSPTDDTSGTKYHERMCFFVPRTQLSVSEWRLANSLPEVIERSYPHHDLNIMVSLVGAKAERELTLLHHVIECTNPSNNTFVPSFSKQHSPLFTGGFGGERDTWTEAAERSTRTTSIAVGERDKACKNSTLESTVSVESIPMSDTPP